MSTSGFCLDKEYWRTYEQKVHSLLEQGLGDRAKSIRVVWRNTNQDSYVESGLSVLNREPLFIGISISSIENAFRTVDIGPDAENKTEALKFRKFWGEKSELRRFKDGRIAESTVWGTQQWTRHLIMKQIVEYILKRHLSLSSDDIVQLVDQLDFSLIYGYKDPISTSGNLLEAFEVFSKCLRGIKGIPLKVSSVQPLDSALRLTSVFPPEPHPLACGKIDAQRLQRVIPSCIPTMEVMIQLEGSGNWPMDDLAIEKTKTAFLIQIAENLQTIKGIRSTATENNVDVFMRGYAFRLRILHERGLSLVKREIGPDPVKHVSSADKMLFIRSQHASMINGLHGRFPIYASVARIIPSAKSLFDVAMLSMSSNNLPSVTADGDSLPTPTYNSSILEDMFLEENSNLLENRLSQWKVLPDALILLKIWARQRSSIYAHDCLNGFLIFVIVSFLARFGYIEKSQNALQIFTKTLEFITTHDFEGSGLFFTAGKTKILASTEENKKFKELFPVLICDPSTHVNLAFRMTSIGLHELRHEASSTLTRMKLSDGGFEEAFMTKIDYPVKYDHCIRSLRLHLEGKIAEPTSVFCLDKEYWRIYEQKVHSLLEQGLGDRAKSIRVVWRNANQGSYVEDGLSVLDREPLFIGISIRSTENAFRMVDIGPDADNKEEAHQDFFIILGSFVWETQQWRRHLIMKQIIEYIFERHLSLYSDDIVQLVDQLDFSLLYGDKDPTFGNSLYVFKVLSKCLLEIKGIPLNVSGIQPLDSALRLTSVFPPEPHPLVCVKIVERRLHEHMPSCIPTMEVMIQLEGPGDLKIEKTKTDFLLQIVKKLQKVKGITRPATEKNVVFMGGYAFRLSILHEIGPDRVKDLSSTDKMLFFRCQHAKMIYGLQAGFPTYAPVARLAKRWVSAHLFSGCLAEEAIELLVAHVFLTPLPLGVPLSRFNGFLRFLRLLADYDWWSCPLIVDRNSDFGINDHKNIN
ncbi:hypothetical protein F2Q68_00006088, partial [Brassica cretica]